MKIDKKQITAILTEIDSIYATSHSLSNDELRQEIKNIERAICSANDQLIALNNALPKVYALVKETARRFSLGNLEVTANDWDKNLAEQFDFVKIVDGKAIYTNHWVVERYDYKWNMIHYDEQLLAGIYLHYGYAIEMATGEGKTLVATLPVFLNALTHQGVHMMTVNDYLSRRDCELTRPIYLFHGLNVDCIEYQYNIYSLQRKQAYAADITFGTNSSFAFDYLYDHLALSPEKCMQRKHNYAIVDELDSVFIDEADNPHVVGGGYPYDNGGIYKKYHPLIKELLTTSSDPALYQADILRRKAWFTQEGQVWLANKTGITDLYQMKRISEIEHFQTLPKEEREKIAHNLQVQNVLSQLLNAYTLYERDVDYVIDKLRRIIIIIDPHTGRLRESFRWEHGLHTAVEVKEGVCTQKDPNSIATISLKNYFKLYNRYCGMSGTIQLVTNELKDVYGLDVAVIPSHRPLIRDDQPIKIFKTKQAKDKAIIDKIIEIHQTHRPILVGCLTTKRAIELNKLLQERGLMTNLLDAKSLDKEAEFISKAGITNTITVSTSIAGRGTDIKLSKEAYQQGGLAIIGADIFDSRRIDQQLKGRAGRQGDPGSSLFFVSVEDLIMKNLTPEEENNLDQIIANFESEEITSPLVSPFIRKAQSNRESFFAKLRQDTARKDDIIAPYRHKLYTQRNRVLFDSEEACRIVDSLLSSNQEEWETIDKCLQEHYQFILPLLKREQANNIHAQEMLIPFADNTHLYVVELVVKQTIDSFFFFKKAYLRQVILSVYDWHWKKFVLHLMEDLNERETLLLPQEFQKMKADINSSILTRIKYSVIPINKLQAQGTQKISTVEENHMKKKEQPAANDPCPCGSGKKFGECHGKSIRQIKSKRRF